MNIPKKINQTLQIALLVFAINTTIHAQDHKGELSNANYVLDIISKTSTTEVIIYVKNIEKKYTKIWLANVTTKGNYIIFKSEDHIHSWNLKDAIFIVKAGEKLEIWMDNIAWK